MGVNRNGQPTNSKFNRRRNIEKAVSGLHGILQGLTGDQRIGEMEMLFLDVWLRNQTSLEDDGDLVDIVDLIGDILKDNVVTQAELDDLHTMLSDIVTHRELPYINDEAKANELIGLITGVAVDGVLADTEIRCISNWLDASAEAADLWPVSVIKRRLMDAMEDGVFTQDERDDLLLTIKQITGSAFEETSIASGMATDFLEDPLQTIEHKGKSFCFTGKFVSGGRRAIEHSATLRGAITTTRITKKLDYLVIGTLASRDWRFTSHGRKIEQVLRLRESGVPITITTERTWLDFLT